MSEIAPAGVYARNTLNIKTSAIWESDNFNGSFREMK
jgi:hypothetical protein